MRLLEKNSVAFATSGCDSTEFGRRSIEPVITECRHGWDAPGQQNSVISRAYANGRGREAFERFNAIHCERVQPDPV